MSDETLKQIVEKLQGKASAHAINGQNYDKDGFHYLANHEYAMIVAYEDAIKTVIQVAQAEPVVHGWWEWFEEWSPSTTEHPRECDDCGWRCSRCKTALEDMVGGYWDNPDEEPKLNYCPNCGAKMKGAKHEC